MHAAPSSSRGNVDSAGLQRMRLDKWLWAARFFKTRTLATEEIGKGRIEVNDRPAKAASDLRIGDRVAIRHDGLTRTIEVLGLSPLRGPAPAAQTLYRETAESIEARRVAAEQRRQGIEPAQTLQHGRPTKRDRRQLNRTQAAGWQRWSASIDDD